MAAGRVGWAVLGTLLVAVAIAASIRDGVAATTAAVVFSFLPLLVRWWPLRTAWIPLAALVAFTVWPVWPPVFSAGLGWLAGIAAVRVFEQGGDGQRGEPRRLGMRVLGLDLSRQAREARGEPGPRAGRASIPRPVAEPAPEPSVREAPQAGASPLAGAVPPADVSPPGKASSASPAEAAEQQRGPAVSPPPGRRPVTKPESRFPANRTPRAAERPESGNAAKPKPAGRPEPGPARKPARGQEPGPP